MRKPKIESSRAIWSGEFSTLHEDLLTREGLEERKSYVHMRLHSDAAVVLAQDMEGRFILNHEYRHPTKEYLLGCPGGRMEEGEDPVETGRRELIEETGYVPEEVILLGSCYPLPAVCNQKIYFIWAKNCKKLNAQNLDPMEYIETELKSEKELREAIMNSSQIDGLLCIALWYKDRLR